jgi:hypothetical protein
VPAPGPGKALCGAQRPNQPKGVTCKLVAGHMTDHVGTGYCHRHGGLTPSHKVAAEKELAQQAVERYGLAVDITPAVALMRAVATSYGSVLYLEAKVAALTEPWSEDKPHVAWQMLMAERKHHADVCRDALRAGVERRAIELAEDKARQAVALMNAFAEAMGWDPLDADVRKAGRKALGAIGGDVIEGTATDLPPLNEAA